MKLELISDFLYVLHWFQNANINQIVQTIQIFIIGWSTLHNCLSIISIICKSKIMECNKCKLSPYSNFANYAYPLLIQIHYKHLIVLSALHNIYPPKTNFLRYCLCILSISISIIQFHRFIVMYIFLSPLENSIHHSNAHAYIKRRGNYSDFGLFIYFDDDIDMVENYEIYLYIWSSVDSFLTFFHPYPLTITQT